MAQHVLFRTVRRIPIYPPDTAILPLNNWPRVFSSCRCLKVYKAFGKKSRKLLRNLLASLSTCSKRKLTKRAPLPLFPCCSSRKKTYMYNVANVQIGSRETKSGSFPNNFLTIFSKLLIDFWGANTTGWSYMKPTHAVQTKKIVRHR